MEIIKSKVTAKAMKPKLVNIAVKGRLMQFRMEQSFRTTREMTKFDIISDKSIGIERIKREIIARVFSGLGRSGLFSVFNYGGREQEYFSTVRELTRISQRQPWSV